MRIILAILACLVWSPDLPAQTPFFQGKTITIRVGFTAGGAFDVWARIIAQYMGKYVPGNPTFVVQNMTGGGSMIAANYVYSVAKPDGLTLGIVSPGIYIQQLSGHQEVRFEWFKYSWIGSPEKTDRIFYIRADTPYKTLEDLRQATEPPKCGATGLGTAAYYFPRFLQDAFGLKLAMVPGYQGAADANLAIEKGEIQCWCGSIQAYFGSEPGRTWAKTGFVRVLTQGGQKRHPNLPEVPTVWELMDKHKTSDIYRRLAKILVLPDETGRPFFGPPGVPADRLKILREGFVKMMADSDMIAEAKKKGLEPNLMTGEEVEALGRELATVPPEVMQKMKPLLEK
ncbi:MAG TPA: tripartite tricarboxylate transporter substrate-binding protein [Candidatus Udaeobacter sp.]|nr:tripartite tricarboxylate transporter substrate-binding protein [Candidatus Udaeobacter sp.]